MKNNPPLLLLVLALFLPAICNGQNTLRVMSYNVENLFDTEDDPLAEDDEFLPDSFRHWTPKRYSRKLKQIGRAISIAGEWDTPALVGLCEVENDSVMTHLLRRTALRSYPYNYCISGRSDRRGIRVALIYRRDKFAFIGQSSIRVPVRGRPTRNILHVWGKISSGDTLDIIVCHFPSKSGGGNAGEDGRMRAATVMSKLADSLSVHRAVPLVIAMGDFNDTPESKSLIKAAGSSLCPLFAGSSKLASYKYRGQWEQIDQIFIHCGMKNDNAKLRLIPQSPRVLNLPFLMIDESNRRSKRPFRTYSGRKYEGGFSDHLPVIADFLISQN